VKPCGLWNGPKTTADGNAGKCKNAHAYQDKLLKALNDFSASAEKTGGSSAEGSLKKLSEALGEKNPVPRK
jgi:hypothetical protein